ncbi:MAG: hypothetical protein ACR2QH_03945 [Geminicoccaceae bacterium]
MIRSIYPDALALLPDQPPKVPEDPPDESLIIKIPPREIRLPEQDLPKPPEMPEIDLPEEELWRWPEMPPPLPPCPKDWVAVS